MLAFPPRAHAANAFAIVRSFGEPIITQALAASGIAWQSSIPVVHATMVQPMNVRSLDRAFRLYQTALYGSFLRLQTALHDPAGLEIIIVFSFVLLGFQISVGNWTAALRVFSLFGRDVAATYPRWLESTIPQSESLTILDSSRRTFQDPPELDPGSSQRSLQVPQHPMAYDSPSKSPGTEYTAFSSTGLANRYLNKLEELKREVELQLHREAETYIDANLFVQSESMNMAQRQCLKHLICRHMSISSSTAKLLQHLLNGYFAWNSAFDRYRAHSRNTTAASLLLHIRSLACLYGLETCLEKSEMASDRYTRNFARIVAFGEDFLRYRNGDCAQQVGPAPLKTHRNALVLEWGFLRAIYLVCIKCRDPGVRRRALRLLASARIREGLHESDELARYSNAIIYLEEEGSADGLPAESLVLPTLFADCIPDTARFSDVLISSSRHDFRVFHITCGRFLDGQPSHVQIETYVCETGNLKPDGSVDTIVMDKKDTRELALSRSE